MFSESEEELVSQIEKIKLLPMNDARRVLVGDFGLLEEMAAVDQNKMYVLKMLKLLGDLVSIRKRDYYRKKAETMDYLTDSKLEELAQVRSNKDSYAKAMISDYQYKWDYAENRYRYYDKLLEMLQERINLYKKFLKPEG